MEPGNDPSGQHRDVAAQERGDTRVGDVEVNERRIQQLAVEQIADHEVIRSAGQRRFRDEWAGRDFGVRRRDRDRVRGAVGDVVLDHLDPIPELSWLSAAGGADRGGVEIEQGYLACAGGDLVQRERVAVPGADDRDAHPTGQMWLKERPGGVAGECPARVPADLRARVTGSVRAGDGRLESLPREHLPRSLG
jgi:hypothetical protein